MKIARLYGLNVRLMAFNKNIRFQKNFKHRAFMKESGKYVHRIKINFFLLFDFKYYFNGWEQVGYYLSRMFI